MSVRGAMGAALICAATPWATAQTVTLEDLPQFDSVYSINDDDLIAGSAGGRAVIGRPGAPVTAVDGGLGSSSFPRVVNSRGQVAGEYSLPGLGRRAFFYDPDLGTVDLAVADTSASSVTLNDLGQVFWVTTSGSTPSMNVRDGEGLITSIPLPSFGSVVDANDRGEALSWHSGTASAVTTYSGGTLSHLQIDSPSYFYTELHDINGLGQAVGRLAIPNRAGFWDEKGGLRELFGPGEADGFEHIAAAINDQGLVALTLIPPTGWGDAEFAFYSLDDGLIRLEQPEFPEPAACTPGTFQVSTHAGVGIVPVRDATLNDRGQALVRIRLECRIGLDHPVIYVPAFATLQDGVQPLPLPRGLQVEDLFQEALDSGRVVSFYEWVDFTYGALNERGRAIGNFRTRTWDREFESTAHLYDLSPTPTADVRSNGSDDLLVVSAGDSVHITLSFDPAHRSGEPGEYWAVLYSSFGNFLLFDVQAELTRLSDVSLFDAPLPEGWYVFLFNVEDSPDGIYQPGWLDYAVVVVTP